MPPALQKLGLADYWSMLQDREPVYTPNPSYLSRHPEIKPKMRAMLLDWLIEVSEEFVLHRETLYLAINFIDRILAAKCNMAKSMIQTLGISCLFIAAKLQEIYPPHISRFAELTDGACTEVQIIACERVVVQVRGQSQKLGGKRERAKPVCLPPWCTGSQTSVGHHHPRFSN
jgi:G1/S-specific cyclin-E1